MAGPNFVSLSFASHAVSYPSVWSGRNCSGCSQFKDVLNEDTGALQRLLCVIRHTPSFGYVSKQNCQYWSGKQLCQMFEKLLHTSEAPFNVDFELFWLLDSASLRKKLYRDCKLSMTWTNTGYKWMLMTFKPSFGFWKTVHIAHSTWISRLF
jgi:hypothetical protein